MCNSRLTAATGTGKTTVAQRMGRMFKQLGVLHSDEVICCAPADFSPGYAGGQAAIKTKSMLEKALGKTLFIDEAYGELLHCAVDVRFTALDATIALAHYAHTLP
jgi:hypothetical protein